MTVIMSLLGPLRGLPRSVTYALLAACGLFLLWQWHGHRVGLAYAEGTAQQAIADRAAVFRARAAATALQAKVVNTLATRQSKISKGSDDAIMAKNADIDGRYDALRLRWAASRANRGDTGAGGTIAVSTAAGATDLTACAARGWVDFQTAAAAAQAADTAIAKDDAWIAWVAAQAAAWPSAQSGSGREP